MFDPAALSDAELIADPRLGAVNHAWREYTGIYDAMAQRVGIPSSVLDSLYMLYLEDGITQKDICDRACLSKQTVHSAVMRLQKDGLIRTERGEGRSVLLFLTNAGRAEAKRIVRPIVEAEIRAYDALSPEEFDQLISMISRIDEILRSSMGNIGTNSKQNR